jgi:5,10-methylene-tetrahydrofolate dehydrogenase/methenyl tetrahydrofolate cyclohydrolase
MQGANLIDGKAIADQIRAEIKAETEKLKSQYQGKVPGNCCLFLFFNCF